MAFAKLAGGGSGSDGTGVKLIKGQTFRYKCFKCDTSGDVINFYAAEHHISNIEAIRQVCALYGLEVPKKKFKKILDQAELIANDIIIAANHLRETDYFIKRGISYETAEKFNCSYISEWIHPTKRNDNKVPKIKAGTGNIFNIDVLKRSKQHVVVVEGEFDALSIIEAGNDAIALGSTGKTALALQMAFQIAQQQQDILYIMPIVFIDYLQILKAYDAHMTDKQAVDYNVISMSALKESGSIEYTADVCLGLQHANMEQIKTGTSTGKA